MKLTQLLKPVFSSFKKKNLDYCIARNYEWITRGEPGKDIDMVIRKDQKSLFEKHLLTQGFIKSNTCPASNHLVYSQYYPSHDRFVSLHLHVGGVSGMHIMHYPARELLKFKRDLKGFFVPSVTRTAFSVIIHVVLDRNKVQDKYREFFNQTMGRVEEHTLIDALQPYMPDAKSVVKLLKKKRYTALEKRMPKIKQEYYARKRLRYYVFKTRLLWWGITRFKSRTLISIIGMDGTGKSTLINRLEDVFDDCLIKQKTIYFGRGKHNVLPIQRFGHKTHEKLEAKEGGAIERFHWQRTLAAPIFAFDLWLRYLIRVLPERKLRDIVITDRFTSDILLMKGVPWWMRRTLYFFLPKSKIVLYLHNKPKILSIRKKHALTDLKRQEKTFKKVTGIVKPVRIKSGTPEKTYQDAIKVIVKNLKNA